MLLMYFKFKLINEQGWKCKRGSGKSHELVRWSVTIQAGQTLTEGKTFQVFRAAL